LGGTLTALVVDDSKSARFAMRKFLESFGYRVDTAESAEDAYLYLRRNHPDLVFLDHIMPGVDGFEAIRALRGDAATAVLPIVLCSSNEGEEFARQARLQGATEILPKPPGPEHIHAVLDRLRRLRERPAPVSAPASSKVQAIREPQIAIGQTVMKALREALPAASLASRPAGRREEPAALSAPLPVDALREDMEGRLRHITQDLFVQVAEIKAQLAHIEGASRSSVRSEERMREIAVQTVQAHAEAITLQLQLLLAQLRAGLDEVFEMQTRRIDQLGASLRQTVIDEARQAAERAVMNAGARISEQIVDSILKAQKPHMPQAAAG
jgi:CheY-like chemotaxis protein